MLTVQTLDNQSIEEFGAQHEGKMETRPEGQGQRGPDRRRGEGPQVPDRGGLRPRERICPTAWSVRSAREYFVPYFRQGDYSTGIYAGTIAVIRTIATHEGVRITNGTGGGPNSGGISGQTHQYLPDDRVRHIWRHCADPVHNPSRSMLPYHAGLANGRRQGRLVRRRGRWVWRRRKLRRRGRWQRRRRRSVRRLVNFDAKWLETRCTAE